VIRTTHEGGQLLADAFLRTKPADFSAVFAKIDATTQIMERYRRAWATQAFPAIRVAEHFASVGAPLRELLLQKSLPFQVPAIAAMHAELAKLGAAHKELVKLGAAHKALGQPTFPLPPGYLDHLWKSPPAAASFANLVKTPDLPVKSDLSTFTQLASTSVQLGVLRGFDTSLSSDETAAPAVEAATDAIQRAHPGLSRSAARLAVVTYFYVLACALLVYCYLANPLVVLLTAALGVSAKDAGRAGGQLFDKLNPDDDDRS
jgi:hypothetical protein